jgi:MOB kinase activator 1
MFSGLLDRNKTFRPKHKFIKGSTQHDLHRHAKETLGSGDLTQAVKLPPNEDLNEWLAINTVDFYNTTNLLYGSLNEFCTRETCPTMSAGGKYEYFWMDGQKYKKPTKQPAPEYVANLMDWIAVLINNESVFPTDPSKFPKDFREHIKTIFKRMFRVYAHIYYSHYKDAQKLQVDRHLNTSFKHFMLFILEFDLVDKKELAPLKSTIAELIGQNV